MHQYGKCQVSIFQKLIEVNPVTKAIILFSIILIIDIIEPLGIAIGIFYLCGFLLVCRQKVKTIIYFAIIASVLTILKLLIFGTIETEYFIYVNRAITVGLIWVIAILAVRHRRLVEQMNIEREAYIKELEEMLFITSHEVRKPITSCLGLMDIVENITPLSQNELWEIIKHLKSSALDLDTHTKKLTIFLSDVEQKNKYNSVKKRCA